MACASAAFAHHDTGELELYPRDKSDACVPDSLQIRVKVLGVSHQGIMKLELYASDKNFLEKKGRLRKIRVPAQDAPQMICINVSEPGIYAVAGYHDQDGDRKLDKKLFKPKEPVGMSNNPPNTGELRMPKFEEAAFRVGELGTDIELILVDP